MKKVKYKAAARILAFVLSVVMCIPSGTGVIFHAPVTTVLAEEATPTPAPTRAPADSLAEIENIKRESALYRIIEIVPTESAGSIGYYVAGQEPCADWTDRIAVMESATARKEYVDQMLQKLLASGLMGGISTGSSAYPMTQINEYKEYYPWDENTSGKIPVELENASTHTTRTDYIDVRGDMVLAEGGDFSDNGAYAPSTDASQSHYVQNVEYFKYITDTAPTPVPVPGTTNYYYSLDFTRVVIDESDLNGSLELIFGKPLYVLEDNGTTYSYAGTVERVNNTFQLEVKTTYYTAEPVAAPSTAYSTTNCYYAVASETTPFIRVADGTGYFQCTAVRYLYKGDGRGEYDFIPDESGSEEYTLGYDRIYVDELYVNNNWFLRYVFDMTEEEARTTRLDVRVFTRTLEEMVASSTLIDSTDTDMVVFSAYGLDTVSIDTTRWSSVADQATVVEALRRAVAAAKPVILDTRWTVQTKYDVVKNYVEDVVDEVKDTGAAGETARVSSNVLVFAPEELPVHGITVGEFAGEYFRTAMEESDVEIFYKAVQDEISMENFLRSVKGVTNLDTNVSMASAVRSIINAKNRRVNNNKTSIKVLDVEPTAMNSTGALTEATVRSWLPAEVQSVITTIDIVTMSTNEFIGKIEDINEVYDLVYIGANTAGGGFNMSGGETVYNDSSMNGLIYTNIGDSYSLKQEINGIKYIFSGLLDRDYSTERSTTDLTWYDGMVRKTMYDVYPLNISKAGVFRFSGNDITDKKREELINFANSGHPIILAGELASTEFSGMASREVEVTITGNVDDAAGTISLTANRSVSGSAGDLSYTYAWYKNGAVISGAASAALSTVCAEGDKFHCLLTVQYDGDKTETATSNTIEVVKSESGNKMLSTAGYTVEKEVTLSNPGGSSEYVIGISGKLNRGKFTAEVTTPWSSEGIRYQWYYSSDGSSYQVATENGTGKKYTFPEWDYRAFCKVTYNGEVYYSESIQYADNWNGYDTESVTAELCLVGISGYKNSRNYIATVDTSALDTDKITEYQWFYRSQHATEYTCVISNSATHTYPSPDGSTPVMFCVVVCDGQPYCSQAISWYQYGNQFYTSTSNVSGVTVNTVTEAVTIEGTKNGKEYTARVTLPAEWSAVEYNWYYSNSNTGIFEGPKSTGTNSSFTFTAEENSSVYCKIKYLDAASATRYAYSPLLYWEGNSDSTQKSYEVFDASVGISGIRTSEWVHVGGNNWEQKYTYSATVTTPVGWSAATYEWYCRTENSVGYLYLGSTSGSAKTYTFTTDQEAVSICCKVINGGTVYYSPAITLDGDEALDTDTLYTLYSVGIDGTYESTGNNKNRKYSYTASVTTPGTAAKYEWYYRNTSGENRGYTYAGDSYNSSSYHFEMSSWNDKRTVYCKITYTDGTVVYSPVLSWNNDGSTSTSNTSISTDENVLDIVGSAESNPGSGYTYKAVVTIPETWDASQVSYKWYYGSNDFREYTEAAVNSNTYSHNKEDWQHDFYLYCMVEYNGKTYYSERVHWKQERYGTNIYTDDLTGYSGSYTYTSKVTVTSTTENASITKETITATENFWSQTCNTNTVQAVSTRKDDGEIEAYRYVLTMRGSGTQIEAVLKDSNGNNIATNPKVYTWYYKNATDSNWQTIGNNDNRFTVNYNKLTINFSRVEAGTKICCVVSIGDGYSKITLDDKTRYFEILSESDVLVAGPGAAGSSAILPANGVTTYGINEETLDVNSLLAKTVDSVFGKCENVMSEDMITSTAMKNLLLDYLNLSKPEIVLIEKPLEYNSGTNGSMTSKTNVSSVLTSDDYVLENNMLTLKFHIENATDATPLLTDYRVKLYLDLNGDGRHADEERISELKVTDGTGNLLDESALKRYDDSSEDRKKETTYTVSREMPGDLRAISWKLVIEEADRETIHASQTGYTYNKASEGSAVTEINILQLRDENYGMNLEENETYKKLYAEVAGVYKINMTSITITQFNVQEYPKRNADGTISSSETVTLDLNDFDMIITGFGDCYGYEGRGLTGEAAERLIAYIDSGKAIMFTHDNTSINTLPVNSYPTVRENASGNVEAHDSTNFGDMWGYYFNTILRTKAGLDRYGVTDEEHGRTKYREELFSFTPKSGIVASEKYTDPAYMTAEQIAALLDAEYSIAYQPGSYGVTVGDTQGVSNVAMANYGKNNGEYVPKGYSASECDAGAGVGRTSTVSQVNRGQITQFPFTVDTLDVGGNLNIDATHFQYYQLNMNQEDIVVWYCLGGATYEKTYNDVVNNYYIFNCGNVTYSGMGHSNPAEPSVNEAKLFINTMIAAYRPEQTAPSVAVKSDTDTQLSTLIIPGLYVDAEGGRSFQPLSSEKQYFYFTVDDRNLSAEKKVTVEVFGEFGASEDDRNEAFQKEGEAQAPYATQIADMSNVIRVSDGATGLTTLESGVLYKVEISSENINNLLAGEDRRVFVQVNSEVKITGSSESETLTSYAEIEVVKMGLLNLQ